MATTRPSGTFQYLHGPSASCRKHPWPGHHRVAGVHRCATPWVEIYRWQTLRPRSMGLGIKPTCLNGLIRFTSLPLASSAPTDVPCDLFHSSAAGRVTRQIRLILRVCILGWAAPSSGDERHYRHTPAKADTERWHGFCWPDRTNLPVHAMTPEGCSEQGTQVLDGLIQVHHHSTCELCPQDPTSHPSELFELVFPFCCFSPTAES